MSNGFGKQEGETSWFDKTVVNPLKKKFSGSKTAAKVATRAPAAASSTGVDYDAIKAATAKEMAEKSGGRFGSQITKQKIKGTAPKSGGFNTKAAGVAAAATMAGGGEGGADGADVTSTDLIASGNPYAMAACLSLSVISSGSKADAARKEKDKARKIEGLQTLSKSLASNPIASL